jgi:REP element-mobilizing transposase RayT
MTLGGIGFGERAGSLQGRREPLHKRRPKAGAHQKKSWIWSELLVDGSSEGCYSNFMKRQLELGFSKRGGAREGAGRPRTRLHLGLEGPGVPHLVRPEFAARYPVHVTHRVVPGVGYLRSYRFGQAIQRALKAAAEHLGMRVVHYSIQGTHLHLLVEAEGAVALSRGMQGLSTRLARRINGASGRRGKVFVDRYHAVILKSPRQVANARRYVLQNYRHHTMEHLPAHWRDPLSTARVPLVAPATWLLRDGWRLGAPGP